MTWQRNGNFFSQTINSLRQNYQEFEKKKRKKGYATSVTVTELADCTLKMMVKKDKKKSIFNIWNRKLRNIKLKEYDENWLREKKKKVSFVSVYKTLFLPDTFFALSFIKFSLLLKVGQVEERHQVCYVGEPESHKKQECLK